MQFSTMLDGSAADHQPFTLVSRPRRYGVGGAWRCSFGLLAAVCLAIGVAFAWAGAWMVLPFAGAEVAGLYWAFRWFDRRAEDFERVTIEGDRLIVETCERNRTRRYEFNRHWAQVVVEGLPAGCRVTLRCHGREVEFGTHLSQTARREAARRLRNQLRIHR